MLEEGLDRLERRGRLAQLVEPERRHPGPCPPGLVGAQRGQAGAEQRDELPVLALALVEPFERPGELGVARLELLQLLQVADGPVGAVREVLRGLGRVFQERRALPSRRRLEGPVVEDEEVVPALRRVEDQLEPIERPVGRGIELQDSFEDADDPRRVVEPLLVELHRALADGHRLLLGQRARQDVCVQTGDVVGSREQTRELFGAVPERVHLRQLARRTHRRGERLLDGPAFALEVAQSLEPLLTRLRLLRIGAGARFGLGVGARAGLAVVVLPRQARLALRRQTRARLVARGRRRLDQVPQDLLAGGRVVGRVAGLFEHRDRLDACRPVCQELHREGPRGRLSRRFCEHRPERGERLAPAGRPSQQHVGHLQLDRDPRRPLGPIAACSQRRQRVFRLARREGQPRDRRQRLVASIVLRVEGERAPVQRESPGGVGERLLLVRGPLEEARDALLLGRVLHAPLEEPPEVGESSRGLRIARDERVEGGESARLVRSVQARLFEDRPVGARGVVRSPGIRRERARARQQQLRERVRVDRLRPSTGGRRRAVAPRGVHPREDAVDRRSRSSSRSPPRR